MGPRDDRRQHRPRPAAPGPPSVARRGHRPATRSSPPSAPSTCPSRTHAIIDWSQIVALYDQLATIRPNPIVRLNRASAVLELDRPGRRPRPRRSTPEGALRDYHAYTPPAPTCCAASPARPAPARPTDRPSGLRHRSAELAHLTRRATSSGDEGRRQRKKRERAVSTLFQGYAPNLEQTG